MREILFRGKAANRIDGRDYRTSYKNGDWVYGLWTNVENYAGFSEMTNTSGVSGIEVDKNTVGQFTGLTDKNGKKVFEGDIVRILGNQDVEDWKNVDYNALIAFLDGGFCAIDGTIEEHGFRRYALARMDFDLEVIGNIHDNPELLEVTDND